MARAGMWLRLVTQTFGVDIGVGQQVSPLVKGSWDIVIVHDVIYL